MSAPLPRFSDEPHLIPDGAFIHESLLKRVEAVKDYEPINLPRSYQTIPMPEVAAQVGAAEA